MRRLLEGIKEGDKLKGVNGGDGSSIVSLNYILIII